MVLCLVDWLDGWLVGLLVGCLVVGLLVVGWLVLFGGWFVGGLQDRRFG